LSARVKASRVFSRSAVFQGRRGFANTAPHKGSLTLASDFISASSVFPSSYLVTAVYDGTEYLESGLDDRESVALPDSGSIVRSCNLEGSSHFENTIPKEVSFLFASDTLVASLALTLSSILRLSVEC
jgi:hypothetical protein